MKLLAVGLSAVWFMTNGAIGTELSVFDNLFSVGEESTTKEDKQEEQVMKQKRIKGDWSEEEHSNLMCGIAIFGERKWKKIATLIEGRTPGQTQTHYFKYMQAHQESFTQKIEELKRVFTVEEIKELQKTKNGKQIKEKMRKIYSVTKQVI